jgi:predicted nucleotidyltransferase
MILCASELDENLALLLPETWALLRSSNLTIHPRVFRITLHGSRGLAGGFRPDSDIDLCLLVDTGGLSDRSGLAALLEDVLYTTLTNWQAPIEADLAAVYDRLGCELKCFERESFDEELCPSEGIDCIGLYKVQKGFNGFVENRDIRVQQMYPLVQVWEKGQGKR